MIPAVPRYLETNFDSAPPGHRFSLYFPGWSKEDWNLTKDRKTDAIRNVLSLPEESSRQTQAIRARQKWLLSLLPDSSRCCFEAISISPLVTGMGMEHPLENGFAFLNPYGIPYLPGSSVKGVLRSAAEHLAEIAEDGWTQPIINCLFGSETQEAPSKGALRFWDVVPLLDGDGLAMDVMTPHYGNYYQGKESPHDAGQPNPIFFMVIPPKASFTFPIVADELLVKNIDWKPLIGSAFTYALDWLGFGAKTSVGYGQLRLLSAEESERIARDQQKEALRCSWVDEQIAEICKKHRIPPGRERDVLLGKPLAQAWQTLEDPDLKRQAWLDIVSRWQDPKIGAPWDNPSGKSQKVAHAIYKAYE